VNRYKKGTLINEVSFFKAFGNVEAMKETSEAMEDMLSNFLFSRKAQLNLRSGESVNEDTRLEEVVVSNRPDMIGIGYVDPSATSISSNPPYILSDNSGGMMILMDNFNLTVGTLSFSISPMPSSVEFYIGKGEDYWWLLQDSTLSTCTTKRVKQPGHWKIRAVVCTDSYSVITNIIEVIVEYPDITTIESNITLTNRMNSVWQETKNAASSSGRRERGFWIYANTASMSYEYGTTILGPNVTGCTGTNASIVPGTPGEGLSTNPTQSGKHPIAFFHTHTPLTYCPNDTYRQTGPSPADILSANDTNVPGILYDYIGVYYNEVQYVGIRGGHDLNASAQLWNFGPQKRPTIPY
jgi:hypothetical protein